MNCQCENCPICADELARRIAAAKEKPRVFRVLTRKRTALEQSRYDLGSSFAIVTALHQEEISTAVFVPRWVATQHGLIRLWGDPGESLRTLTRTAWPRAPRPGFRYSVHKKQLTVAGLAGYLLDIRAGRLPREWLE